MRIITNAPIIEAKSGCGGCHSNADGPESLGGGSNPTGRDSNSKKAQRQAKRSQRKAARQERRAARRAKRGARPLKAFFDKGKKFFHDRLHPVKKNADGSYEKTLADGSTVPVDPKNLAQLDPSKFPGMKVGSDGKLLFDKLDLNGRKPTAIMDDGVARVATIIQEKAAVAIPGDNGDVEYYKEEDTKEEGDDSDEPAGTGAGMSTTNKWLIGLGIAAVVGGIIYAATRKK